MSPSEITGVTVTNMYLVTVKLHPNPEHDPANKVTGPCPLSSMVCTDVTGEHHTMAMIDSLRPEELKRRLEEELGYHVTRIERVHDLTSPLP